MVEVSVQLLWLHPSEYLISGSSIADSILLLEWTLQKYKDCDADVSVLLASFHRAAGNVGRVQELCRQLDIKYVQVHLPHRS